MVTLTKKFRFETAHRMGKGYTGKCTNIHGHSWNGSITVECEELDEFDMGVDYKSIGKCCKLIEDEFDHKLVLQKDDKLLPILLANIPEESIVIMDNNPTTEAIAEFIYNAAVTYFRTTTQCKVINVKIQETCTTECVYTK